MKITSIKNSLKDADYKKGLELLHGFSKELFSLRINASQTHVKDYSQFKKLRKNIARSLTYLQQKINSDKN